jgi:hypothetical protein
MKGDGFFIAVANASVSIIVLEIFYDKLLPNVDDFEQLFCIQV